MTVETLKQFTKELAKKITFNTENLYQHNIMIRFNDGNRKACASFINNDNTDYTKSTSKFIEYMKNTYPSENSNATGNLKNLLLCDGYYKNASNVWYYPKALFYSTDDNALRVLALQANTTTYAPNPNSLVVLSEYGTTFTVNDYVTTVALNNVNKGSFQEFTTNLSYNGTKIADIKWTMAKYPTGDGKFHYHWFASGSGNVSVVWEKWSSSVSWSYVTKMVSATFPTGYNSLIQDNIVYDWDIVNVSCSCCKNTTGTNANCYFERPNTYETATRTIKFKAQADYVANS